MIPATDRQGFAVRSRLFIRWTSRLLFIAGGLAVSYVALILLYARLYQRTAGNELEAQIHAEVLHTAVPSSTAIKEGDVLGRIEIPRIGVSVAVLQGTTSQTLRLGVGHIEGTALPGQPGNIGIAGHRDTYFRDLKDIRRNDEILLQTAIGIDRYEVDWLQITAPSDGAILSSSTGSALTLVTCYPFHYIGSAPERYVVHAHRL
jgi:sortase A